MVIIDDSPIWLEVDGNKTETSPHAIKQTMPPIQMIIPIVRFLITCAFF